MRTILLCAAALLLATQACAALAGSMYKCVSAHGKTSYTQLPCPAEAKAAQVFTIAPPESEKDSAARLVQEQRKRRMASDAMRGPIATRSQELDARAQYGPRPQAMQSYVDAAPAEVPSRRAAAGGAAQSSGSSGSPIKK